MPALTVLLDGLSFPEGPRWHDGRLWFSDFYTHAVIAVDLDGKTETICTVPGQPSGLGWLPDGRLLVVSMKDQTVMRLDPGGLVPHADLSGLARHWCNDMTVDAEGRAYVGNFGFDYRAKEAPRNTTLVRIDPDGSTSIAADDLFFPNGTAITPDGKTMVVAESWGRKLTAFDKAADGTLSNRRTWADGAAEGAAEDGDFWVPDGICMDAEGAVWIADPVKKQALRIADGGAITERVSTDDRGAYAVALGGADRQTLLICTNIYRNEDHAANPTGRIEMTRVAVPGDGWP
jgi:sugar lactone lactonase YvrE